MPEHAPAEGDPPTDLVELVDQVPHARDAAARTVPDDARPLGRGAFYLRLALASLLAAGAGAVILFFWAFHISNPCPCTGGFCILGDPASSGADAHLDDGGVGLGMSLGGVGLLIVTGCLVSRFRTRLSHPFVTQVFGFTALYILALTTVWAVARGAWGPTKC